MIKLTFRQKLIITYAACALVLIFITFAGISFYVNSLQKSNVQNAVKLAEEQARSMAVAVSEIMIAHDSEDFEDPAVQAGLRAVTQINLSLNDSLVLAAIISPNGDRYIEEFGGKGHLQRGDISQDVYNIELPDGKDLKVDVTAKPENTTDISTPIPMGDGKEGRIQLRILESQTFTEIQEGSQQITRALVLGSLLMLLSLLGIFYILWRMFFRQLQLQENNARLDRMAYVGTLASGLAHEIRNPLSAMNVNLEVIREDLSELDSDVANRTGELSRRVQNEVAQLNSTLTNFLDFALPRKEGYSHFPLRGLVEDIIDSHAEQAKAQGISIELNSPSLRATVVEADRHLLHQAIRNVLLNAIQILAGSVKKSIKIHISARPKDRFRLAISDSGPGISEDNLARIFEVFYSTRKGGSGFGLAIARKILEEHEGKMWATNNTEALGATFTMELPRFAPREEPSSDIAKAAAANKWVWPTRA